ncbi:MAG: hypothetical protein AB1414_08150 [bacterium]
MPAKKSLVTQTQTATKAQNLGEMINLFDPQRPLVTQQEQDNYFVLRSKTLLEEIERYLITIDSPVKILFSGHRGSGKSTELNHLALLLQDRFFIVRFSILKTLSLVDLNYIDIILMCGLNLINKALEDKVKINEGILHNIQDWLHNEIIKERIVETPEALDITSELNLLVVKLTGKITKESITRTIMRQRIEPRLEELIDKINLTISEIEEKTAKKTLIIIEDIDKVNLQNALNLFFLHGTSLTQINSRIIYTFPIALQYSNDFPQIKRAFHRDFILPNIFISDKQGNKNLKGIELLKRIILTRVEAQLIAEEAIQEAINLSGGVISELISLVQDAALKALASRYERIDKENIIKAGNKIRQDYQALLTTEEYEVLERVHKGEKKRGTNEPIVRDLLHNLALLEYRNDDLWIDVHPIVKDIL